jgi:branched-chain amino acid transport system ATP-binding protein
MSEDSDRRSLLAEPLSEVFTAWGGRDTAGVHAPALTLRNLEVRFGGVTALSDVSLEVAAGSVVAVIGPNGAGKSTLLNAISGLIRENAKGEVLLRGRSVAGRPAVAIARAGIGRSFQDPSLIDTLSVLENVMLGEHLRLGYRMADQIFRRRRVSRLEGDARRRARTILRFMDLTEHEARPVSDLPYGSRKLVDIARAISSGPDLLLLDEPTSGLDAGEQEAIARIVLDLHRVAPVTILLVEHHMDIVRTVASKVIGLESGTLIGYGSPAEVLDSEAFRAALVGGTTAEPQVDSAEVSGLTQGGI